MHGLASDGRKRRRLTPTSLVMAQPSENLNTFCTGLTAPPNPELPAGPGTWDHLARWRTADDIIIDFAQDNEECYTDASDGSLGSIEGSDDEGEDDHLPIERPAKTSGKVTAEEVTVIINSCIEEYENAWIPGKGETKRKGGGNAKISALYDPLILWEDAEATGQRETLARKYESEAAYYRQRLDKLCDEIAKDPGNSPVVVRTVSQCLLRYATPCADFTNLDVPESRGNRGIDPTRILA